MNLVSENGMRKLITIISCVLLTTALQAQTTGQLYNEGKLYVSPGTLMTAESDFINDSSGTYKNNGEVLLKGNYENEGYTGFSQAGGITRFEGYTYQLISGTAASEFYNVLFNNAQAQPAFGLSNDIYIAGEVNFLRGIVDNKQYGGMFIFQPGSGHFNASDASYVEGFVDKLGDDSFWYPVGEDGYYRPAATVFQVGKQTHFATKYYLSNSDLLYPHQLKPEAIQVIDNREYWQIENVAKTDNQTFVSLTWDEETTPSALIQAAQDGRLGIVRWDAANNMWVDKGGTINLDEKTVTAEVDGFGVFTFGVLKNKHLLPCHIIVYNAVTPNGDGVNDYFRIDNQGNCAKDLHVEIFNRWGVKVFETDHYGPGGDVFDGYSSGRLTIRRNKTQLPTGTYFYILEYQYNSGNGIKSHQQAGYLYLSGN